MESVSISEIVLLAKKLDALLNNFDNHLKNVLLFRLFESPEKVLPDYKKKYYRNAIDKKLISEDDVNDIKYWRNIRNELVHKKTEEITPQKFLYYSKEMKKAQKKFNNLKNNIIRLAEIKRNEDEFLIFRSFEEFINCGNLDKPTLILYTPNSPRKNRNHIFNLYIVGDKKGGKTAIIREFFDPEYERRIFFLQIILSQIFMSIYDYLRPNKFKRVREAINPLIKITKNIAFRTLAIGYYFKIPKKDKFHLIVHEADIFSKSDLIRTDMFKGQIVGIIFSGFERFNKADYELIYRKLLDYYGSSIQPKINQKLKEFNYTGHYLCSRSKTNFFQVVSNLIGLVKQI